MYIYYTCHTIHIQLNCVFWPFDHFSCLLGFVIWCRWKRFHEWQIQFRLRMCWKIVKQFQNVFVGENSIICKTNVILSNGERERESFYSNKIDEVWSRCWKISAHIWEFSKIECSKRGLRYGRMFTVTAHVINMCVLCSLHFDVR